MKKYTFDLILTAIGFIILAGFAAYFSVFGLTKLFVTPAMFFLAGAIEYSKLIVVSIIYRHWKKIKKFWWAWYLVLATVVVMFLTSMGIYGFLTSSYQTSANKIEKRDGQIKLSENKKTLFNNQLVRINNAIESDNNRINTLSGIREQQEKRASSLYDQKYLSSAKRTEIQINNADDQIKSLNEDITLKTKSANSINDSISFYDQKILEAKTSDVSNEIGPWKFVAELTGVPMNKVVNILTLIIIFVFDPMAIALLIVFNYLLSINGKKEEEIIAKPEKENEKISEPEIAKETVVEPEHEEEIFEQDFIKGKEEKREKSVFIPKIKIPEIKESEIVEEPILKEPVVSETETIEYVEPASEVLPDVAETLIEPTIEPITDAEAIIEESINEIDNIEIPVESTINILDEEQKIEEPIIEVVEPIIEPIEEDIEKIEEPIIEQIIEEPIIEKPIFEEPITEEPITEEPIIEEPIIEEPIIEEPIIEEPIIEEPKIKPVKREIISPAVKEFLEDENIQQIGSIRSRINNVAKFIPD